MNELALFAGFGGGILASESLGFTTVAAVENDWARRCLIVRRQRDGQLQSFPIWDDVCTFPASKFRGTIDIISGGFPCQAFSTAARGRNTARNLWPEMRGIIEIVESEFVFAENVTAKAIEQAGKDLSKMGYRVEMLALSAADCGADHVRERFWLLAYTNDKSKLLSTINAKMEMLLKFRERLWETFPDESGMADGGSRRVERFEACGNGQILVVAATALWTLANA